MNDSTDPPLRTLSEERLKEILAAHETWLREGEEKGFIGPNRPYEDLTGSDISSEEAQSWMGSASRTKLRGVDLRNVDLSNAKLQGADLRHVDLRGGSLWQANLGRAWLEGANLEKVNIVNGNLKRTNLANTNLKEAILSYGRMDGARLVGADLQGADLGQASLKSADLTNASLIDADLHKTDLNGATLDQVRFGSAKLKDANLRNTNLSDAVLPEVTGLLAEQIAGANVSGAELPEDIHRFDALSNVQEASVNSRKLLISVLLGCVYSWLTIATTTDVGLLTNSTSSPLPIIQAKVPIAGFYWAAPSLLACLCIYFHIYLQHLWEALADLPAVFPDGKPLDKRAYPWFLNGLVRAHFALLRKDRPLLSHVQQWISVALAWGTVPLTVLLFWGRYLSRHGWSGTILHVAVLGVTICTSVASYRLAAATLRGEKRAPFSWKQAVKRKGTYVHTLAVLGCIAGLVLVSLGAIEGKPHDRPGAMDLPSPESEQGVPGGYPRATGTLTWVPRALAFVGFRSYVDFSEADVSVRPTDRATTDSSGLQAVKGARLRNSDLRYANAQRAFLVNADLRQADLTCALLTGADLRGANLEGASLLDADLRQADLRGANLRLADLSGARISDVVTAEEGASAVHYYQADLRGADLSTSKGLSRGKVEFALGDSTVNLPTGLR